MGLMTYEEYTTKFLELLRYVPYIKDEKEKVQRFISGFPSTFKDWIEYDEPRSLEEVIGKLKHYYDQLKRKTESKKGWKGNDKNKVHIFSDKGKDVEDAEVLKRYPTLQQFQDVFPTKISELFPYREVDFSIELVPGAVKTSNTPYKMSTPELVELKL
eukprot:PITA_14682